MKRTALALVAACFGLCGALPASAAEGGATQRTEIEAFGPNALVLSDGTYWVWGGPQSVPTRVPGIEDAAVPLGDGLVRSEDGALYVVESDPYVIGPIEATKIEGLRNVAFVYDYWDQWVAVDESGRAYLARKAGGHVAAEQTMEAKVLGGLENVVDVATYDEVSDNGNVRNWAFLREDGTVLRSTNELTSFEPIPGLIGVVQLEDQLALQSDGTVWRLTTEGDESRLPVRIAGLENIADIVSVGGSYAAIDESGRLYFWGETRVGWSDGTIVHMHDEAVPLTGVQDVVDAWIAERTLLALTADGDLFAASISVEQLPADVPFELLASDVEEMTGTSRHAILQKKDGTLWGWGVNKGAALGLGDYEFMHDGVRPMQPPVSVVLNGETIALTTGVVIRNGQAFLPLRSVFERLGASPEWNAAERTVTIERTADGAEPVVIIIDYDDGSVTVNGEAAALANDPFIIQSTSYLPLRFVSETLGAKVDWMQDARKIMITM